MGQKKIFFEEIIAENFPNLGKNTDIQIQGAQGTPTQINKSRPTPRHIAVTFAKHSDKEKEILKAPRKMKSLRYKERPILLAGDFSTETWQARRDWHDTIKVLNGSACLGGSGG